MLVSDANMYKAAFSSKNIKFNYTALLHTTFDSSFTNVFVEYEKEDMIYHGESLAIRSGHVIYVY